MSDYDKRPQSPLAALAPTSFGLLAFIGTLVGTYLALRRWPRTTLAVLAGLLPPGSPLRPACNDVRRGVATGWLELGLHPGIASAALGHSSPAFTMSQYQHVIDGMSDRAAEALEAFLAGGR